MTDTLLSWISKDGVGDLVSSFAGKQARKKQPIKKLKCNLQHSSTFRKCSPAKMEKARLEDLSQVSSKNDEHSTSTFEFQ